MYAVQDAKDLYRDTRTGLLNRIGSIVLQDRDVQIVFGCWMLSDADRYKASLTCTVAYQGVPVHST